MRDVPLCRNDNRQVSLGKRKRLLMLKQANENARRCYQRALVTAQKAFKARNAADRKFWSERESFWLHLARSMIVLDDTQVQTVMTAAAGLPTEKRDLFLKRIEAARRLVHRGHFSDAELNAAINVALRGLRHDVPVPTSWA
jgi:hypothetical protein